MSSREAARLIGQQMHRVASFRWQALTNPPRVIRGVTDRNTVGHDRGGPSSVLFDVPRADSVRGTSNIGASGVSAGLRHNQLISYYDIPNVDIHHSSYSHGVDDDAIRHALDHAITVFDLDPDGDPPKVLGLGPDRAGNLLEVIWLELADGVNVVIHAMPLRPKFYELLPRPGEDVP